MTLPQIATLAILVIALILFITEKLRVDLVALGVLATVVLFGLVTPAEALEGLSNPAVVTVAAVFVISEGLRVSGVADQIANLIGRLAGPPPPAGQTATAMQTTRLIMVIMLITAGISAFMNNIGAAAILLPAVVTLARERRIAPSKLLMPMAWAALMGGNLTLIGTPPNIIANGILETYSEIDSFGFFDFTPMGLITLTIGTVYMAFIGQHLLPNRGSTPDLIDSYTVREYLCSVRVDPSSPLVNQTVRSARLNTLYRATVVHLIDNTGETRTAITNHRLQADDILLLEAAPPDLQAACLALNLTPVESRTTTGLNELVEVTPVPRSRILGRTLRDLSFRDRFGATVLALRHRGKVFFSDLADQPLALGDIMLVEATSDRINQLRRDPDFLVLDVQPRETRRPHKAPLAVGILLTALASLIFFGTDTSLTLLIAALLMVYMNVLDIDDAYKAIDWKIIFLIAGMIPLGTAMELTGATDVIADAIVSTVGQYGPLAVLMGVYVLAVIMTEVLSNAAAAVLIVPLAIEIALGLGVNPRAFVMGVVMAISLDFLTPIGHQVNVLIYTPGGYKFTDYFKVGIGLTLLMILAAAFFLPVIWPF